MQFLILSQIFLHFCTKSYALYVRCSTKIENQIKVIVNNSLSKIPHPKLTQKMFVKSSNINQLMRGNGKIMHQN